MVWCCGCDGLGRVLTSTSLKALTTSTHCDTRPARISKQGPRQSFRALPVCQRQEARGQRRTLKHSVVEGLRSESDNTTTMPQHSL